MVPLPTLLPGNDKLTHQLALGKQRVEERRRRSANSLSVASPKPDEIDLIHSLYLRSKRLEQKQSNRIINDTKTKEEDMKDLQDIIWMHDTAFSNTVLMHLQNRNIYGMNSS